MQNQMEYAEALRSKYLDRPYFNKPSAELMAAERSFDSWSDPCQTRDDKSEILRELKLRRFGV